MDPFVWQVSRKRRNATHTASWWTELVLGEDQHGRWAVQPSLTPCFRDDGLVLRMADPILHCYPRDQWWVASFFGDDRTVYGRVGGGENTFQRVAQIYVDIAVPAEFDDISMSFIDLTLDVVADGRGAVTVEDADDVAAEARQWGTPPELVARAAATLDAVHAAVVGGFAPFDGDTAKRWFERYRELTAAASSPPTIRV